MLDDSVYREFQSMPFQGQLQRSSGSVELRETLLINEIFKCGREIFGGSTDGNGGSEDEEILRKEQVKGLQNIVSQRKYIYEYDYGRPQKQHYNISLKQDYSTKDNPLHKSQNNSFLQYSADQISFTFSNQDNPTKSTQKENYHYTKFSMDRNINNENTRITWKDQLIENSKHTNQDYAQQYLINQRIRNNQFKTESSEGKVGKWKKPLHYKEKIIFNSKQSKSKPKESSFERIETQSPIKIKDTPYKKTFDLSNVKVNYFLDSAVKKRKSIFDQKTPQRVTPYNNQQLNQSSYYPQQRHFTYLTPQKNSLKKIQIPLSQQITKNIYGRLKQEVTGNSFIKELQIQQKKAQQHSQQIWKNFIDRSDSWIEKKKNNLIERQARQKYQMNFLQTRQKNQQSPVRQQQYYSYADMKHHQQQHVDKVMRFQQKKFQPQYTFKNKQSLQKFPQKKRQSSVENCINKLKTQTQLLKVKLLSPLKSQLQDDQMLNHYKQLNQSQNKRLVRKFSGRQDSREFNKILRTYSGIQQLKTFYGNCIGNQKKKVN